MGIYRRLYYKHSDEVSWDKHDVSANQLYLSHIDPDYLDFQEVFVRGIMECVTTLFYLIRINDKTSNPFPTVFYW